MSITNKAPIIIESIVGYMPKYKHVIEEIHRSYPNWRSSFTDKEKLSDFIECLNDKYPNLIDEYEDLDLSVVPENPRKVMSIFCYHMIRFPESKLNPGSLDYFKYLDSIESFYIFCYLYYDRMIGNIYQR